MPGNLFGLDLQVSLRAEPLFKLGPLTVTNSIVYGLVCAVIIATIMVVAARRIKMIPRKGPSALMDMTVSYVVDLLTGPFGSYEQAIRFMPVFGFYFFFIIFNNLMELMPFVGPGAYKTEHGLRVDLFRPFTADLNGTVAMAVIAIIMVQYLSIREQGAKKHLLHYFSNKPKNPLYLFIGVLEMFTELTRILSLSLRLFLNTAVGEILLLVFTSIILAAGRTPFVVLPIMMFEALVAYIQAYVFMSLSATYLGLAIAHADDHHTSHPQPDKLKNQESVSAAV